MLCFLTRAHENITDFSSYKGMEEGGWNLENIHEKERLLLPGQTSNKTVNKKNEFSWFVQNWIPALISTSFWGSGRVNLKFGNCNKEGEVSVLVDGTEIAKKSAPVGGEKLLHSTLRKALFWKSRRTIEQ